MSTQRSQAESSAVVLSRRARVPLAAYCHAHEELRRLGIIRTAGPVAGQFAEWLVDKCLGLRLLRSP